MPRHTNLLDDRHEKQLPPRVDVSVPNTLFTGYKVDVLRLTLLVTVWMNF